MIKRYKVESGIICNQRDVVKKNKRRLKQLLLVEGLANKVKLLGGMDDMAEENSMLFKEYNKLVNAIELASCPDIDNYDECLKLAESIVIDFAY